MNENGLHIYLEEQGLGDYLARIRVRRWSDVLANNEEIWKGVREHCPRCWRLIEEGRERLKHGPS